MALLNKKIQEILINISLANSNSEVLKKYAEVWSRIKDQIRKINGHLGEYDKDYIKIKFESDDDLPLNKILKFRIPTNFFRRLFV